MQKKLRLPVCKQRFQKPLVPYFALMIVGQGEEVWDLGEDYSFCERARRCGYHTSWILRAFEVRPQKQKNWE